MRWHTTQSMHRPPASASRDGVARIAHLGGAWLLAVSVGSGTASPWECVGSAGGSIDVQLRNGAQLRNGKCARPATGAERACSASRLAAGHHTTISAMAKAFVLLTTAGKAAAQGGR